jgi:hypothetical protein
MLTRLALLCGFAAVLAAGPALAGQHAAPPPTQPLQVGGLLKVCDQKPDGTVSGWLRRSGSVRLQVCIDKITGENKKPGENFDVFARSQKVDGKDKWEDADIAILRRFAAGDRVEVEWFKDDNRFRVASIKLTRFMPRQGALAGKVVSHDKDVFGLEATALPQGCEDLKGQTLNFSAYWMRNPDTSDKKHPVVPNPDQLKLYEGLQDGDLLEVAYKADNAFRTDNFRKTGHVDVEKKADPPAESKDPKKDPPTEKKPPTPPKDDDF